MWKIFEIIKNVFGAIGFGVIFMVIYGFMFLKAPILFPNNVEAFRLYLQYSMFFLVMFFMTYILVKRNASIPLFRESFISEIWIFLLSGLISFFSFYLLFYLIKGNAMPSIISALSGINFVILLIYAFVVSFPEELEYRWIFPSLIEEGMNKIKDPQLKIFLGNYLIPTIFFAGYHWALGRSWTTLIIYIPLGFLFTFLKRKYGLVSSSGCHFSWDIFIFAFFPQ